MAELSRELSVPIDTLRYWRLHGTGPKAGRLGRRVLYRRVDVDKWLDESFDKAM